MLGETGPGPGVSGTSRFAGAGRHGLTLTVLTDGIALTRLTAS